jgi:hypothetical protein
MSSIYISILTGVGTALILGIAGFLWRFHATLSVIVEKLGHMTNLAELQNQRWNEKFLELEKDVIELKAEFHEWRKGRLAA